MREQGVRVESLAEIASLDNGTVTFVQQETAEVLMMKQHPFKIASLGIQHMLAMYAGAIIVPLIVGGGLGLNQQELTYLVSIDLLMCGVATILQALCKSLFRYWASGCTWLYIYSGWTDDCNW